ncbi:alkaline phosphatase family protein [Kutzneria sp. 744]|uniref:alkaline phosphatase family protein n=1 Tax=Kutzneria sp. (strain 744) TaxID=345341 RepID=UPI0004ACF6FF|nr:alkaline phosphatase family protein [Kutzneria sp. 744]
MSRFSPLVLIAALVAAGLSLPGTAQAATCSTAKLPLPDAACTPGATNPDVTPSTINKTICVSGWTATVRPPTSYTNALKKQGISDYGYSDTNMSDYEEDHLIPLELGGAPRDPHNLWPEPHAGAKNAYSKDAVENRLKKAVCDGEVALAPAQKAIAANWMTAESVLGITPAFAPAAAVPRPDHVLVVIDENHAQGEIVGNANAPYITGLSKSGANFTNSHAISHPSQPNYLALFSGSMQGVTSDTCPKKAFTTADLGGQALAAGIGFAGYSESMPSDGYTGCTSGTYARKHNPWVDFADVPASSNLRFTGFPTDYTKLPAVSFVVPNLQDDMHDGTVKQGDTWLKQHLDGYIQWAKTHNSVFVLTFDEDDNTTANIIPTIITGAGVKTGNFGENINHYSVLRTIEDAYGLPHAGAAANATPITDIWG